MLRAFSKAGVAATLVLSLSTPSYGAMVLPLSVNQMANQAGKIFVGRCLTISKDLDEQGIPATFYRFRVLEAIKGVSEGETVLVKQYGIVPKALSVGEGERVILPVSPVGAAPLASELGEESLLFLYPESDLGFTSAVGLGQGKFLVHPPHDLAQPRSIDEIVAEVRAILREDSQ